MKEARKSSPFAADQQGQLDKWICRQHQQQEVQDEQRNALSYQNLPSEHQAEPVQHPRHGQYDAIINKMRCARRMAGRDQQWSG